MLKKVFLALFGLFIVIQAVGVFAWGNYLHSQAKAEIVFGTPPSKILLDSKGQLWVQPMAAIYSEDFKWEVYKNGQLIQTFDMKSDPNFPSQIVMDYQGNLYGILSIGNSGIRIVTFDGSAWNELTEFTPGHTLFLGGFAAGAQDDIWIGGASGLFHYNGDEWQTFALDNSALPDDYYINTIFLDSRNRLWIGSNYGIAMFENREFQTLTDSAPSGVYIYSLSEGRDGTIWAGGNGNLYSFDGAQWTVYNSKNSKLQGSRISDIEVDSMNRVWALSSGGALSILDGATTKYLFGKPGNAIENIEIGPDNALYMMRLEDVGMLKADVPLVNLVTLKFLWLLNNGIFVYLSIFLAIVWLAFALNSWGIGASSAVAGLVFWGIELFLLFDINGVPLGYINPGFALTIFTFIGGLVGYFIKRRGVKHADFIGGGIGCVGGGALLTCVLIVVLWGLTQVS